MLPNGSRTSGVVKEALLLYTLEIGFYDNGFLSIEVMSTISLSIGFNNIQK
jgi:hypothetical protein